MSFAEGVFPKLLKNAVITPLLKSGFITEPSNYRPISILTFVLSHWKSYFIID